ncbi:unnamed protein product [Urochloa humidicola]
MQISNRGPNKELKFLLVVEHDISSILSSYSLRDVYIKIWKLATPKKLWSNWSVSSRQIVQNGFFYLCSWCFYQILVNLHVSIYVQKIFMLT